MAIRGQLDEIVVHFLFLFAKPLMRFFPQGVLQPRQALPPHSP